MTISAAALSRVKARWLLTVGVSRLNEVCRVAMGSFAVMRSSIQRAQDGGRAPVEWALPEAVRPPDGTLVPSGPPRPGGL
ncbi:hypothetical protein D3C72_2193260 [compost metagenome]